MKRKLLTSAAAVGMSLVLISGGVATGAVSAPQDPGMAGGPGLPSRGQVTIGEPGEYILQGEMRGQIRVDPGQGQVKLVLDGARLDGGAGPAITAVSGERLSIELAEGSQNQVTGGQRGGFSTVFSQVPLEMAGGGRLDLWSPGEFFAGPGARSFRPGGNVQMNPGQAPQETPSQPTMPGNEQGGQQGFQPGQQGQGQQNGQQPTMPGNEQGGQQGFQPGQQGQGQQNGQQPTMPGNEQGGQQGFQPDQQGQGQQNGQQPTMPGGMGNQNTQPSTDTAGEIVEGVTENSAMALEADMENATAITLTEENGTVKISEAGTYVVTGSASEGGITVKKGTTGVVLILEDLDLTSTSGAALSINKNAEVQVVISGNVTLTDNENPEDENSADAEVADAYDGAAIKIKAESVVFLTGDGTLTVNGNAKNGIKAGDNSSLILGGDVTVNINAANDGINGNYDVTILSGDVTISAGDDGIHADHILTVGQDGQGPNLTVTRSNEGLEGTVVNIAGGKVNVTATDDGINAANGDGAYEGELGYSVNITGGDVTVKAGTDGIDSNGNVNLVSGSASIRSANNGGDAGIDYDGDYYVSDSFNLNNQSGVAGPDQMPGQMGGMPGQMGGQPGRTGASTQPSGQGGWLDLSQNGGDRLMNGGFRGR